MTNTKLEQIRQFAEDIATKQLKITSAEEKPKGKDGQELLEMDTGYKYYWYNNKWNLAT